MQIEIKLRLNKFEINYKWEFILDDVIFVYNIIFIVY